MPLAGVQVRVPEVFPAPVVNTALFPAGNPVRFAVRELIASPSGSDAVTDTVTCVPTDALAVAGALTAGARSTLVTVIAVVAEPESALLAVNVTL